jgi:hypothetical protein
VDINILHYVGFLRLQVKDLHYQQSFTWGGTEIKVWFGKVEDLPVYFLEPQNGYAVLHSLHYQQSFTFFYVSILVPCHAFQYVYLD